MIFMKHKILVNKTTKSFNKKHEIIKLKFADRKAKVLKYTVR